MRPATWLRAQFATPPEAARAVSVLAPVAVLLNLTGLGRGHAFVNGHDIGRYWRASLFVLRLPAEKQGHGWVAVCARGAMMKVLLPGGRAPRAARRRLLEQNDGSGKPTQSLYYVPQAWLEPAGGAPNTLVRKKPKRRRRNSRSHNTLLVRWLRWLLRAPQYQHHHCPCVLCFFLANRSSRRPLAPPTRPSSLLLCRSSARTSRGSWGHQMAKKRRR